MVDLIGFSYRSDIIFTNFEGEGFVKRSQG